MKTEHKIIFSFVMMCITMVILFQVVSDVKDKNLFEQKNGLCIDITDELNRNINDSSTCLDYFCYYARYSPPEGYDKTETLCICDCMTENGTVVTSQILNVKSS